MAEYLGEVLVKVEETPYASYTKCDWILYFLEDGHYDGAHHKQWAIDQATRIIHDTEIIIKLATWKKDDGTEEIEYRVSTGEPSEKYKKYVTEFEDGEDGPHTYEYDEGIAP
jgi:hypothetical protein